jgi:putative hydrolase of the HAD superfamily
MIGTATAGRFRWLAFDAVGTLIYPDPPVARIYWEIGRRYGSRLTEPEVEARFRAAFRATERNDLAGSSASDQLSLATSEEREFQRWRDIVARVIDDVAEQERCFEDLYAHFAQPASWRCFPDTGDALRELARAGYRLAVASNFDRRLDSVCDGLAELQPISLRVISATVGYRKPSREFYAALCRAADCRPAELLMIGDDFENDIVGAEQAGAAAVFIDRRGHSRGDALRTLRELPAFLARTPPPKP